MNDHSDSVSKFYNAIRKANIYRIDRHASCYSFVIVSFVA